MHGSRVRMGVCVGEWVCACGGCARAGCMCVCVCGGGSPQTGPQLSRVVGVGCLSACVAGHGWCAGGQRVCQRAGHGGQQRPRVKDSQGAGGEAGGGPRAAPPRACAVCTRLWRAIAVSRGESRPLRFLSLSARLDACTTAVALHMYARTMVMLGAASDTAQGGGGKSCSFSPPFPLSTAQSPLPPSPALQTMRKQRNKAGRNMEL